MNPSFLSTLWNAKDSGFLPHIGIIAEPGGKGFRHYYAENIAEAAQHAKRIVGIEANAYFTPAVFKTKDNRKAANAAGASCFWLDIDCGEAKAASGNGYATQGEALIALKDFCATAGLSRPSIIVSSGYGLHVYWHFHEFIPAERWRELARKLKILTQGFKFRADPSRTADIASVLRVPGTMNFKNPAEPKTVTILRMGAPIDFNAFAAALEAAAPRDGADADADALGSNTGRSPPSETPENLARVKAMLAAIPPDIGRADWIKVVWATLSTGWDCAEELAREWSRRGEEWDEDDFAGVVKSFKPDGGVGFGTLVHIAKAHSWTPPKAEASVAGAEGLLAERLTGDSGDVRNGKVFAVLFGDQLLFVHETNEVLKFDPDAGWIAGPPHEADRAAKEALAKMRAHAAERWKAAPEDKNTQRLMAHVERSSQLQRLRAMIDMAKSEPGMTARLTEFDDDPMLLGVANGVLDLRTGQLIPVSPRLLVSKRCNVAFDQAADCPRFRQFLLEVQPEGDMRAFLRRWVGYCLTGHVNEQMFIFLFGLGANGKSVFVELIAWLLGDYAKKIATEMLMQHQRNPQGASPDIVDLKGRRFVYCSETEEGHRLAASRVKELTGGDTLTGRPLYGSAITFQPTHKLAIVGNHKPEIGDNSHGMWRRVALTGFDQTIEPEARDPHLLEKLKDEGAGILNWALGGLRDSHAHGLRVPNRILAATAAYRDEMDIVGEWIAEKCDTGTGCSERKDTIYKDYEAWAKANGQQPLAQKRLTRRLGDRGYKIAPDHRTLFGIALKQPKWGNL